MEAMAMPLQCARADAATLTSLNVDFETRFQVQRCCWKKLQGCKDMESRSTYSQGSDSWQEVDGTQATFA